jgi:sulfur carrier protein
MVRVLLNGRDGELPEGAAVPDAVAALGTGGSGVAVAVNGAVVPRAAWAATRLGNGDAIEVVMAVPGG